MHADRRHPGPMPNTPTKRARTNDGRTRSGRNCPAQARVAPATTCVTLFSYQANQRRRRDSNPRSLRSAVFKTAAFDHSATPPETPEAGVFIGIERRL